MKNFFSILRRKVRNKWIKTFDPKQWAEFTYARNRASEARKRARRAEVRRHYGEEVCQNKIQFKTRKLAWNYALGQKRYNGFELGAYQCTYCGRFHLSKKVKYEPPKAVIKKFLKKPKHEKVPHYYSRGRRDQRDDLS